MSTFDRVKTAILRDMASAQTHTASSWATILLRNTNRLTDVSEQKKFWNWLANPQELERESSVVGTVEPPTEPVVFPKTYEMPLLADGDDEKCPVVTMEQTVRRNGLACYINVRKKSS